MKEIIAKEDIEADLSSIELVFNKARLQIERRCKLTGVLLEVLDERKILSLILKEMKGGDEDGNNTKTKVLP